MDPIISLEGENHHKPSRICDLWADCGALEQHQLQSGSTWSGVAMVTTDILQEVRLWATHCLGEEAQRWKGVTSKTSRWLLQST
jgi:hypothetical protein